MNTLESIGSGVIAHQCNCMGWMGCGVALAIRRKYPLAYSSYRKYGHRTGNGTLQLGMVQLVQVTPTIHIANLMAQFGVSRQRVMTDYDALDKCLAKLQAALSKLSISDVWFPNRMGSGNAGGDWSIVSALISKHFPHHQLFFNPSSLRK